MHICYNIYIYIYTYSLEYIYMYIFYNIYLEYMYIPNFLICIFLFSFEEIYFIDFTYK